MTLKITPGAVVTDGHLVVLPAGLTGSVTTSDGRTYNLGAADEIYLEADSHAHATEIGLAATQFVAASDESVQHDDAQSRKNLGLKKSTAPTVDALNLSAAIFKKGI